MLFTFELAHGYQILLGSVVAENEEGAIKKIDNKEWDDILDEYDTDVLTEGYELLDIR